MVGQIGEFPVVTSLAEVGDQVTRTDDGLGLEHRRRGRDPHRGPQRLREFMDKLEPFLTRVKAVDDLVKSFPPLEIA